MGEERYDDGGDAFIKAEGSALVGRVYDLGMPNRYSQWSYDDYVRLGAFDRLYVLSIESAVYRLVTRAQSMNVVPRLLGLGPPPLPEIQWLELCEQLSTDRLTSIRDCAAWLVHDVYELSMKPRDVSAAAIQRNPAVPETTKSKLRSLAEVGQEVRDDRNLYHHQGRIRTYGETWEESIILQAASYNKNMTWSIDDFPDFKATYTKAAKTILNRHFEHARSIELQIVALMDEVHPEFEARFSTKFRASPLDANHELREGFSHPRQTETLTQPVDGETDDPGDASRCPKVG